MHRRRHGHRDGRGGPVAVRIARRAIDTIVDHAREAAPAECCGLLLGSGPARVAIDEAVRIPNVSDDPNRFLLEPAAHITARRLARGRGLSVVGFYHSHPHSSPAPSMTDLLEASYPDHRYLIVSLSSPAPQIRLFTYTTGVGVGRNVGDRQVGGTFVETPFMVGPSTSL